MFLMIDNYDSFVYNLVRYFRELNEEIVIMRNDALSIEAIKDMNLEGIILSPGPGRPESAGLCEAIVKTFQGKVPILGICLGHQVIGHVFGADIVEGEEPVHGKVHEVFHDGTKLFGGIPSPFKVTRYHSLIIDDQTINKNLIISAQTADGVVMGVRHKNHLVEGVQFHPEAELTEYGHKLLKNFVQMCRDKEVQ